MPFSVDLAKALVAGSKCSRGSLKKRLIKHGIMKNECQMCGQGPSWQGKPLVMVLDHINGVKDDNRLENLRLLCPNCNSQTETFAGRNTQVARSRVPKYCSCGVRIGKNSTACRKHAPAIKAFDRRKVKNRPPRDKLQQEVQASSLEAVGRKYGVSGNAVKKWLTRGSSNRPDTSL